VAWLARFAALSTFVAPLPSTIGSALVLRYSLMLGTGEAFHLA
jgi:hypothetical protein